MEWYAVVLDNAVQDSMVLFWTVKFGTALGDLTFRQFGFERGAALSLQLLLALRPPPHLLLPHLQEEDLLLLLVEGLQDVWVDVHVLQDLLQHFRAADRGVSPSSLSEERLFLEKRVSDRVPEDSTSDKGSLYSPAGVVVMFRTPSKHRHQKTISWESVGKERPISPSENSSFFCTSFLPVVFIFFSPLSSPCPVFFFSLYH